MHLQNLSSANVALALALIVLQPAFAAAPAVNDARSEVISAETGSTERKAALSAIDDQIERIERAVDNAPEEVSQQEAEFRLDVLKSRRSELRKDYAAAMARELKADALLEYEKVAAWTKETARDMKQQITGPEVGPADTADAAVNPETNAALVGIALYRLKPSPENKGEVKAALEALDDEIDRLDDYAADLPKGETRAALEKRIKALEKREKALKRDFTSARWDALVADVKREWHQTLN